MDTTDMPCLPMSSPDTATALPTTLSTVKKVYMTPHQFRHFAGELILRAVPGQYALVQQVLGHAHLKTTLGFYAANQSRAAGRVLDEIISARRRRGTHQ